MNFMLPVILLPIGMRPAWIDKVIGFFKKIPGSWTAGPVSGRSQCNREVLLASSLSSWDHLETLQPASRRRYWWKGTPQCDALLSPTAGRSG